MPDPTAEDLLAVAHEAAAAAAAVHRRHRGRPLRAEAKSSPTDPVTVVDAEAEAAVLDVLARARPDDAVLGEEGGERAGRSGVRWVVDPLDGTVNFLYGVPSHAVSVAAELDGRVVAGVVIDTASDERYWAAAGHGAHLDGTRLRLEDPPPLERALVGTGFAYQADTRADQGRVVAELLPRVRDIRRAGSAAVDLCWLAAGRLDGFYERGLNPWDRAAGVLVVTEAGGLVTDLDGGPPGDWTIGAAGPLHAELVAALAAAGAVPRTMPAEPRS